ncbi:MAG: hypothetical protein IPM46_11740 [Flavobacteriales bacterium]|nr:hypothetical protein [Flavobacteriales bacterium]
MSTWMKRAPLIIGSVILLYVLAFAWRFADERLYADSGYYLIRTINEGGFRIEHGRWVLGLAEWLPLLGSKLGADLPAIIRLHSLGNVVFLLLASAYALLVLRDHRAVLMLCTAQLIGLTHGLFCPVFELYYGMSLIILLHATLSHGEMNGYIKLALASLLLLLALSSHPMAWLLLVGAIALLDHRDRRAFFIPMLLITVGFAIVRWQGMSVYEAAQLGFAKRLVSFAPLRLFAPETLMQQALRIVQHYPDTLTLSTLCGIALWHEKRRRTLLLFVVGMLMLFVLTGIYLPDATHDRYREQVDFGFTAWMLLVLFARVWPLERWRVPVPVLLLLCVSFRMTEAERVAPYYTKRTQWHRELVTTARKQGLHKAIIDLQGIAFGTVDDRVSPYWSTGVETLILSAKEGPEATVSVITTDDAVCPGIADNLDYVVLRCWDVFDESWLDPRWFQLPHGRYEPIEPTR